MVDTQEMELPAVHISDCSARVDLCRKRKQFFGGRTLQAEDAQLKAGTPPRAPADDGLKARWVRHPFCCAFEPA